MNNILILPPAHDTLQETAKDQLNHFCQRVTSKMDEYNEFLKHNSVVVFAVNYIQNRFIAAELCTEVGKLFEILNVKTEPEFKKAIEALRTETDTAATVEEFETVTRNWDSFIEGIEKDLDEKVQFLDTLPELCVGSKAISHYVKGSSFQMVLVVVVRCFHSQEITQHIMGLYNKISEFRKLGCDVYLLTRGGAYIKLIGVPFRKLYDEDEALAELKAHRHSAMDLVGWEALVKGGTILVDKSGNVLYKFIEEENVKWPTVDDLISQVSTPFRPKKC
ncbi:hypothetical protein COOONC_21424 [Cooperia oncophora]